MYKSYKFCFVFLNTCRKLGKEKDFDHALTPAGRMMRMREKIKADPERKEGHLKQNERVKR